MLSRVLLFAVFLGLCGHTAVVPGSSLSEDEARRVAITAFVKESRGKIKKYKVRRSYVKAGEDEWLFFFQGVGEDARPGYHAIVRVNRYTRKAAVELGE